MNLFAKKINSEELSNTKVKNSNLFNYYIKYIWSYPPFALILFWISSMFISSFISRLLISVILAYFPWREFVIKLYSNNYKHLRTQVLVLLQVLTTSVSSGYSLEKSFQLIRPVIEHTFGKKSVLIKPLINLENNIKVHMDIKNALDIFAHDINFPETIPVFGALAISTKIGNNSLSILRSSCQMLSEINSVQNEINASNAGKNAEAVVLCIMPFAITSALDRMGSGYLSIARTSKIGSIILMLAFAIAIISSALLFKYITHSEKNKSTNKSSDKQKSIKNTILSDFANRIMPISFISSRYELFNELSLNPKNEYEKYLRKQILVNLSTSVLLFIILIAMKQNLIFVIPGALLFWSLGYYDKRKEADKRREELMQNLPLFICLMTTLLQAGLQLPKAIEICSYAFSESNCLKQELKNLRALIISGITASDAIERLSVRIQIPEAQAALLLISRYGRLGTEEVLNLLSIQSSSCWNLCRNAARKKQEREALGLLFPMTLDFICVLLVATTPAIISLGI